MPAPQCIPDLHPASRDSVQEYLRALLKLDITDCYTGSIYLGATLGQATSAASKDYTVPADRDFIVFQIHGSYRSSALNTEPVLNANLTLSPTDLAMARASNCTVELQNKSKNLAIFDENAMPLNALLPPVGSPIFLPPNAPLLLPSTHVVQAKFALDSVVAAIAGNDAEYGVVLSGVFIPHRK